MKDQEVIIITHDPANKGGVLTMVQNVYALLSEEGREPTLAYAGTLRDSLPKKRLIRLGRRMLDLPSIQQGTRSEMRALAVPTLPGVNTIVLQNHWFARRLRSRLADYDEYMAVGVTAHLALPLVQTKRPFLCWIATTMRDELEAKADVGDEWAAAQLRKRSWPSEEEQERECLSAAPLVLTLSQYTADCVRQLAPQANVRSLPIPIDIDLFCPDDTIPRDHPPKLIFMARYNDPRKNVPLLLKALSKVRKQIDVRLQLIGEQPAPSLVELSQTLGIREYVEFVGRLPREALIDCCRKATLFVLPSRQEGLGIVVLEAMACGLPVVSTRCGGPEHILRESGAGVLTEHDPDLFAQAVLDLLTDKLKWQTMSQTAIRYAQEHFSWEIIGQQFRIARREISGG